MLMVKDIRLSLNSNEAEAVQKALTILRVKASNVKSAVIAKISVDARKKPLTFVYTVAVELDSRGAELSCESLAPCITLAKKTELLINHGEGVHKTRPVVCGFGPSGIFAALLLARNGANPIVLERGSAVDERVLAVENFWKTGTLQKNTNVQFGEGGAGTFSDGKLTTRINDELCSFVTDALIKHGASPLIAMHQKPHIGTDHLREVIKSIRKEIVELGGEIRFNCTLEGVTIKNSKICKIQTSTGEIECETLILAIGHSARDTFEMLSKNGVTLTAKPFSVGFRAEHLQSTIDKALYHEAAGHKNLPIGEYQLSAHVADTCVYTFCMCPGGLVVPSASEENRVVTNGMSYHARDGKNANSAVVVSVNEADFGGDALKAIEFQRQLEQAAFVAGGGAYKAPCQSVQGFLTGKAHINENGVEPSYMRGVTACDIGKILPTHLTSALQTGLKIFGARLKGFTAEDAVITGVETRTSSPVRILRNQEFESVEVGGLYPCGEGAGYAGGIMSAAVDGLRVSKAILQKYKF